MAQRRIEEARRNSATTLDLDDLALVELPPDLRDLPHLRTLYLSLGEPHGRGEAWDLKRQPAPAADLSPLSNMPELQSLRLMGNRITDLSPLSGMAGLRSLDLRNVRVTNLSAISRLARLQNLRLQGTWVTDLSPLSMMVALQNLDLHETRVTDLSPLSGLATMRRLVLWHSEVTDLSPLSGLAGLHTLRLMGTRVTDLSPLSGLAGLRLVLSYSQATNLSPLSGLTGLQSLELSGTRVADLAPLSGLPALQSLDLSGTRVADLAPLSGLIGLQSLKLKGTGVTDLAPLSGLFGLQSLDLGGTGVTDLSPLCRLGDLRHLDLYGSRSALPASMLRRVSDIPRMAELRADRAIGVPREILSRGPFDNCLARLRTYFAELELGAEAETEVKVILLGNGRAGKTQLCRRFHGESYDESVPSTHGVQIRRQPLRLVVGGQRQEFQVNWWDFGGQDIYHGTHALFLRSRAVFLVLWTPSLENRDEFSENGIPLRNQPLVYWLDYVRSLAGKESPVILVQSQCDSSADRRPNPRRPEGFGFFQCCSYSAKTDLGRTVLESQLNSAVRHLTESGGPLAIGRGRAAVRQRLYEWRTRDQQLPPMKRRHRTLTPDGFRALCEETGGIVSWQHALDYFHQTGVVFYRPDLFANRIVLDQDWALDAIYAVFHRASVVPWLRDLGRFTRRDLAEIAWQKHAPDEQALFLGMMESCGICFRCGEDAEGEPRYVAPDLLPPFDVVASRLHGWKEEPGMPTLRLAYQFLHDGVIRGLMCDVGSDAGDNAEYWKYGFWLKDGLRASQILVQVEDTSTGEAPGAGALVLRAQGDDPLGLLHAIRARALRYSIGAAPDEQLTLGGTTVARATTDDPPDGQVLDVRQQPVAVAAAFFDNHDDASSKPRPAGDAYRATIHPVPLSAAEKPEEVFLSYAWGDETPEGRLREEAVDRLQTALAADGFQPVRDRDQIRSGERISAFIRRLTRADLIVAVISDKYLRSPYCMYELYMIWKKCQGDADEMEQRVVPIVLTDVRISTLNERASYVRFWLERAATAEKQARDLGWAALGTASFEQLRLLREYAWNVDAMLFFVQDTLVPRYVDGDMGNCIEAVRDALRRMTRR